MFARLFTASLALAGSCFALTLPLPGIAQTDREKFTLDGESFYFAGTNAYWFSFFTNLSDTAIAMDQTRDAGLKVVRTWGFNDLNTTFNPTGLPKYATGEVPSPDIIYYQSWDNGKPTINFGSNGLAHFDQVVELAGQKGLKLIVTLTNNWADYGGMDVYTVNLGGQFHDDFYTNPTIKAAYKNYVKAVVSRYRTSPHIFAWELCNEPRLGADSSRNLPQSTTSTPQTLIDWVAEMSQFIKSIDPFHLVTVGDEGFFNFANNTDPLYNGSNGVDSYGLTSVETIDFGTFHLYPDWWSKTVEWANQFIIDHATMMRTLGKPVVMEEYGWMTPAARLSNLGLVSNITRVEAIGPWQQTVINEKLAADLYWQLGVSGLSIGDSTDDGFTIFFKNTSESVPLIYDHVKQVDAENFVF